MKTRQQQLTFEKGITNVPSNVICSDNALQECVNLTYRDGEHHVIQQPKLTVTFDHDSQTEDPDITSITRDLLYVHRYNGQERYIIRQTVAYTSDSNRATTTRIQWGTIDDNGTYVPAMITYDTIIEIEEEYYFFNDPEAKATVTSIGKTLIFTTPEGLRYAIWNEDAYDYYEKLPEIKFEAWLDLDLVMFTMGDATGIIESDDTVNESNRHTYEDFVVGLFAESKKEIAKKNGFAEPFFAMAALEMYDGTYTMMSNPILLPVAVTDYYYAQMWQYGTYMYMHYSFLNIAQQQDFRKFSDIVKGVTVFITQGVSFYNTTNIIEPADPGASLADDGLMADGIRYYSPEERSKYQRVVHNDEHTYKRPIKKREQRDIDNSIKGLSVFYKLCDIGLSPVQGGIGAWTEENTVLNLTTQPQLQYSEYFSHAPLYADFSYAYNARLNIAGIHRGFFPGFEYFTAWSKSEDTYEAYVRINTEDGTKVVKHTYTADTRQDLWFYYPDPRAEWVTIYRYISAGTPPWVRIVDYSLTEHPSLNGAYYFHGLPIDILTHPNEGDYLVGNPTDDTISRDNYTEPSPEYLPNQIATSEVNNPFVFLAHGYNTIGTGNIIGMAALTQALSQGQFGQYPLLVFTDEGIWAMSLDNTGLYQSVHPMSREVCSNPQSITQTDNAVFFVSEKGLMVVAGNQVQCVSPQLSGKDKEGFTYRNVFADCKIAYDYRDSLLWIFNISILGDSALVYSINSGTFSFADLPGDVKTVVNNYPDYLLQIDDDDVYSLMRRPDINEDTAHYTAHILTRPLKLENAFALKSIMQIQHVEDANLNSTLTFRIFASNNNEDWVELDSLRGIPWKYYQFSYDFDRLDACDTFAGTVLISQERRTNKLR